MFSGFNSIIILLFSLLALYLGKFLFLPLFFSIFFFIILKSLCNKLLQLKIFSSILNYNLSFIIVSMTFLFFTYFIGILLESNLSTVIQNASIYQNNLAQVFEKIKTSKLGSLPISMSEITQNINFTNIFSKTLNSFTDIASNFSLIIIYLLFIILEEKFFLEKIIILYPKIDDKSIFSKINDEIFNYFQIKTLTSFVTGVSTFLILYSFKSDLAIFFGIIAFLLNFIPFIGSLISVLLPFIFSLIQFLDFFQSSMIMIFLIIIQLFVGNFIEPKLIGKSLNLSPIVMLLTLSIMSKLWGISGMFLSIPILVVLLIVFSNFNSTKKYAIFLSEKGQIR